ncbi:hypothetical protein L195_g059399, partial [Trifolium pratense]
NKDDVQPDSNQTQTRTQVGAQLDVEEILLSRGLFRSRSLALCNLLESCPPLQNSLQPPSLLK